MKKIMLLLAPGFEEIEALGTCDVLRRLGLDVALTALSGSKVIGAHGIQVAAEAAAGDLDPADFAAVVLPGGMPGAVNLLSARDLVAQFHASGKVTAAICAAPIVLSAAGVLRGRRFTMYPGFGDYLAPDEIPTGRLVERDGGVITGKGPGATVFFAAEVARALGIPAERTAQELAAMFVTSEQ